MANDLFSEQADAYKKYRPVYPQALYDYILSFVAERGNALDVATGNGQAATALANHFKKVYAIDSSAAQLQQAEQKENIEYLQRTAEQTFLNPHTFDLITVAQAYHWLQHESFATEVKRIAKPAAVLAVWMYDRFQTDNTALNELMDRFYFDIVGPYWDAARKHVDKHYKDLPLPFDPLPTRSFSIETTWNRQDIAGYLFSWSSVQSYTKANGRSPLPLIQKELYSIIPKDSIPVQFPVYLHLGRIR
jgi:ubiquinone/menaquinone biosynthesis C-methylase UbiE